jgi:hypothetical protein
LLPLEESKNIYIHLRVYPSIYNAAFAMEEPSLDELQASAETVTDSGEGTEYTSRQKLAMAAGVAAIGAFIGYTLVQSYRAEPPQAIWVHTTKPNVSTSASLAVPQIAFVNLHEELHHLSREGLHGWLDLHNEVQLVYPTVMFVEEEETSTFADITGDVRRATLFAHAELHEAHTKGHMQHDGAAVPSRRCTIVYRSVTEVEGVPLEDWDVEAPALRRWHGKSFTQRHCLGFTVDGQTVTLLTQDVSGILLTSKVASTTGAPGSPSKLLALHDGASLLRECGVPSTTTFRCWWPPTISRAAMLTPAWDSDGSASLHKEEKAEALRTFARAGHPAALWRSPFALFSMLGAVLRYNRPDFAVFPRLLSLAAVPVASSKAQRGGLWSFVKDLPKRLGASLLRYQWESESEKAQCARRDSLSAPFLLLVKATEGSTALSTEALKEVEMATAAWVRHFAAVPPQQETPLVEVQREKGGRWGVRVDLTRVRSTVVEAAWLLTHVVGILAAVGVTLASVQLVAIPGAKSKGSDSLLYPTPESESQLHYWKPFTPSGSKGSCVGVGAQIAGGVPALPMHPGWISVEVHAEKRLGFVVAQHDFASL